MNATKPRKRQRRKAKKTTRYPGQRPGKGGHISFPVAGCDCAQCETHRKYDRRDESATTLAQAFARYVSDEPLQVLFGGLATEALIRALTDHH